MMRFKPQVLALAFAAFAIPASAQDTVRFGSLRVPVQVFAGMGKGLFEAEGLSIETTFFKSGSEIAPAIATGQVDVAITTSGAALFNALARGADFTIVAEALNIDPNAPGGDPTAIMVSADSDIKSGADLAGKKIAVTAPGQILDMIVDEYIGQSGISVGDVTKVGMAPPDMVPALSNGSVDAAIMIDPFQSIVAQSGTATRLVKASDVIPGTSQAFIVFSNDMMGREDVGVRFLRAFKATNDWMRGALATPEGRAELAGYFQQYVPAKDASTYERIAMGTASEDLMVNVDGAYGLNWQMQVLIDAGLIPKAPDLDAHLNFDFLNRASQ